jgi:preprotein translocase subunit SecA
MIIKNNLVQIKTGEGKSVTLAALSIIYSLCGYEVRCACYSEHLSRRDFEGFEAMFDQLDLK